MTGKRVESIAKVLNDRFLGDVEIVVRMNAGITEKFHCYACEYDTFIEYTKAITKTRFFNNPTQDYDKYEGGMPLNYGIAFRTTRDGNFLKVLFVPDDSDFELRESENEVVVYNKKTTELMLKVTK